MEEDEKVGQRRARQDEIEVDGYTDRNQDRAGNDQPVANPAPISRAATEGIDPEDKKARSQAWRQEGMQVAIELIQQMQQIEGVHGVHLMAIEWEEAVKPIIEGAGLYPRPTPEPLSAPDAKAA